jgi:hypothetical protein
MRQRPASAQAEAPSGRGTSNRGRVFYIQREMPGLDSGEPAPTWNDERARRLQEALAAYNVDVVTLRDLAAEGALCGLSQV